MPAQSKEQKGLFTIALEIREGKIDKNDAWKEAVELAESNVSNETLKEFAKIDGYYESHSFDLTADPEIISILESLEISYEIELDDEGEFLEVDVPHYKTPQLWEKLNNFIEKVHPQMYSEYPEVYDFLISFKGIQDGLTKRINPLRIKDGKWVIVDDVEVETPYEVPEFTTVNLADALKAALAEEFIAWYQYLITAPFLTGLELDQTKADFAEFGKDELDDHAQKLLEILSSLGDFSVVTMTPSDWNCLAAAPFKITESLSTIDAINLNIESERLAIDRYTSIKKMSLGVNKEIYEKVSEILADEEEHYQRLNELKAKLS